MSLTGRMYYDLCATRPGHRLAKAGVAVMRHAGLLGSFSTPLDCLSLEHDAVRALMRLWRKVHWSSGDGMMPPDQLLAVYRLAASWPVEGDVVELGAWTGLTTCYLATACQVRGRGMVYAVDTFEGTKEGGGHYASIERYNGSTLGAFRERVRQAELSHFVHPLVGFTTDAVGMYPGRSIRVLLIDADHAYDGVRADFEAWSPLVAPGGLIVFHDYLMADVARFVDQDVRPNPDFAMEPGHVVSNVVAVTKRGSCRRLREQDIGKRAIHSEAAR